MIDQNKIKFLLSEYSNFYMGAIRCEALLKALKSLPPEMVIRKNEVISSGPGLPPTMRDKTVAMRIGEAEIEFKLLSARLKITEEMLKAEPGGKEALDSWQLEIPEE